MRIRSFDEMVEYFGNEGVHPDDLEERMKLLPVYQYSVIVEGDFVEIRSLNKWLEERVADIPLKYKFYEICYHYGFYEYFFNDHTHLLTVNHIIPRLYAIYPDGEIMRSNGDDEYIQK